MKRQVRIGVFETNSSMTHALTMCSASEYQKWVDGELYWSHWNDNFRSVKEVDNELGKDNFKSDYYDSYEEMRRSEGYLTYDEFDDYDYMPFETFDETYTTPNGEIIYAFGYYGHD
jgi:hypothetical protein